MRRLLVPLICGLAVLTPASVSRLAVEQPALPPGRLVTVKIGPHAFRAGPRQFTPSCEQADATVRARLRQLLAEPGVQAEQTTVRQAGHCAVGQWWQADVLVRIRP